MRVAYEVLAGNTLYTLHRCSIQFVPLNMPGEDLHLKKDVGAKKKMCRRCEFTGKVNQDQLCGNCEEETRAKKEICPHCECWVENDGIGCDFCGNWYHRCCESIKQGMMKELKGMIWICKACTPKVKRSMDDYQRIQQDNSQMKMKLKVLEEENNTISRAMEDLKGKIEAMGEAGNANKASVSNTARRPNSRRWEVEAGRELGTGSGGVDASMMEELRKLKQANDDLNKKIKDLDKMWERREEEIIRRTTEKLRENMEEMEEKEAKKKNVIVFNIPEPSKSADPKEREQEDKDACKMIFRDLLRVEDAEIEGICRLGREEAGKKRPVVVTVNEVGVKWHLVKMSMKLKEMEEEKYRNIRIYPDLTKKEREENARLREEIKELRKDGVRCIIKKGKIVYLDQDVGRRN